MISYFYDTYALIEYINENPKYKEYFQENKGVTTKLNLMELYYAMLKDINKEKAEIAFDSLLSMVTEIKDESIKEAMKLRLDFKNKKLNISYVDAIGYQTSLENGIKFLTGDREFKGMKNVQFVK
ncbi:MAG: PIN domain-containing protein [archaeon]